MQTTVTGRTILVAEDEPEVRNYLEMALRCQGYRVECVEDGEEALRCLADRHRDISLVLLDIMMPRKDGLETLREIRRSDEDLPIIMLSGASAPLRVVEAMKSGATDFLGKPVSHEELGHAIQKALQIRLGPSREAAVRMDGPPAKDPFFSGNVRMKRIDAALGLIAGSEVPVLLQGESGVGKEVLARRLHAQSPRAAQPFLKLNCAAMPSELLESELFGYERGAFTGAFQKKPGKFELADGGTVLLDEIGDMDFKLQAKLLQVLQDHEFQRLGGKESIRVDVRVLAATHCDLDKAMLEGRFREDLYYRLNVINIQIPPLRERSDEILPLARLFLKKHGTPGRPLPEIPPALAQALLEHDWPGNIRELENVMRKFLVFLDPEALVEELRSKTRRRQIQRSPAVPAPPVELVASEEQSTDTPLLEKVQQATKEAEAAAILSALHSTHWNRKQAADLLRLEYKALLYKMKRLAIDKGTPLLSKEAVAAQEPQQPTPILESVNQARKEAETDAILVALDSSRWNRKQAATVLGVDYKALLYKMKKLGIGARPPVVRAS